MKPEFIALGLILTGALYFFWTQKLRTDITALLVMLFLALPWPRPDGRWSAILSPQEAFSGFGSVAVIMVTAMFVFSAALVRTGAAEMIGGRLFRACAHHELLLQIAYYHWLLPVPCLLMRRQSFSCSCRSFWGCARSATFPRRAASSAPLMALTEVMVTPQSTTVGLTLDQLDWAKRQDVTIVGVIREGERMPPNGWMKLHPGDALIMQGAVPTIGNLLKSTDFAFMEEVKIGEQALRSLDLITVEALLSELQVPGPTMQQTNFGRDYGFTWHFAARADDSGTAICHAT